MEEQVLRQNFRDQWVQYGDANSRYFHAQMKMRTSHNTINSVYTSTKTKLTDSILVEREFTNFFPSLMGEAGPIHKCPDAEIIKKGNYLNHDQQTQLIKEVTRAEILEAIKSMPQDKSPGVDGFPIEFFTQ